MDVIETVNMLMSKEGESARPGIVSDQERAALS